MEPRYGPCERPQEIPDVWKEVLVPPVGSPYFSIESEWHKAHDDEGFVVYAVVHGDGTELAPFLVAVWVPAIEVHAHDEDGEFTLALGRYPTMQEIWDALELTLEGALFAAPMYMAGVERPDVTYPPEDYGTVIAYRQVSSKVGTAARKRMELGSSGGMIVGAH